MVERADVEDVEDVVSDNENKSTLSLTSSYQSIVLLQDDNKHTHQPSTMMRNQKEFREIDDRKH
jgi:hypothetical protein